MSHTAFFTRVLSAGLAAGCLLALGCERPSETTSVPVSNDDKSRSTASRAPATQQATERDKEAMREGLRRSAEQAGGGSSSQLPSGHPPLGGGGAQPARQPAPGGDYTWEAPSDWQSKPPRGAMRKAEYTLPRVEGDTTDGELVMFDQRTLSGGGSVDDNLARWRGMMQTPDGKPVPQEQATREDFEANGVKIAMIDVPGKYTPSMMPGAPAAQPIDNGRMLAAVVDVQGFQVFVRAVGPDATMQKHRDAFKTFLGSFKMKG